MTTYLLRRLGYALAILLGVNLLTFFLFFTVNTPDDMARLNIGGKRVTQEQIDKWKAERGYDRPLYWNAAESGTAKLTRTVLWERSVSLLALQFGRSDSGRSVDIGHEVRTRMWVSLQLALPLFILQLIVSIGFSLLLVFFRHSRIDFWGVVLCVVMLSISSLFYIIVGQFLFSRVLKLVPISGYAGGLDAVRFLLLPVLLSLLSRLGSEARLYRAMFLEEIGKDYVRTARAKGLSELRVLGRHVLRNALIPIITSAGSYLPYVFLGSLVFESFFGIPGLGAFVIEAISGQDFAIVRTMVFLSALLYIASNLLIDLAYSWVDPRVPAGLDASSADGFKFVFLWTDLALWALFAALAAYGWSMSRQPPLRATWARAMHDGATLGAAAVLALFVLVSALDSVHFRRALPAAPGQAPGRDVLRHAHHVAARPAAGAAAADARVELFGAAGHARADQAELRAQRRHRARRAATGVRRRAPGRPRARLGEPTCSASVVRRRGRWPAADLCWPRWC